MTQQAIFKKGDLILYDRYGSHHETISPSSFTDDYAIGIILDIVEEKDGGTDNSYVEIVKEDGSKGFFSLSYLNSLDQS